MPCLGALETGMLATSRAKNLSFAAAARSCNHLAAVSRGAPLETFVRSYHYILFNIVVRFELRLSDKILYVVC